MVMPMVESGDGVDGFGDCDESDNFIGGDS